MGKTSLHGYEKRECLWLRLHYRKEISLWQKSPPVWDTKMPASFLRHLRIFLEKPH